MASRGMTYSDRGLALRTLKRVGYYRLSAYTYPFREPVNKQVPNGAQDGRSENFLPGSTFEQAVALYNFDSKLRSCLGTAMETLEVGLAIHMGYVAGKRDPFVHLKRSLLDTASCSKPDPESRYDDVYEAWLARYERHRIDARNEEFVKHFTLNYESKLPIWVATEVLSFGSLVRLFSLLEPTDRNKISELMGVKGGMNLHKWLLSLNVLRNHCAHHGRAWNRVLAYPPSRLAQTTVDKELHHLSVIGDSDRGKLYFIVALLAYLVLKIDPDSNWPRTFKTLMKKFPATEHVTPLISMGFPPKWDSELLWNYDPKNASRN